MSQFTWKTAISINSVLGANDTEWRDKITELQSYLPQWIIEGKTDGWLDLEVVGGKTTSIRYWIDEAAAQAWVDLVNQQTIHNQPYEIVIEQIPV